MTHPVFTSLNRIVDDIRSYWYLIAMFILPVVLFGIAITWFEITFWIDRRRARKSGRDVEPF